MELKVCFFLLLAYSHSDSIVNLCSIITKFDDLDLALFGSYDGELLNSHADSVLIFGYSVDIM